MRSLYRARSLLDCNRVGHRQAAVHRAAAAHKDWELEAPVREAQDRQEVQAPHRVVAGVAAAARVRAQTVQRGTSLRIRGQPEAAALVQGRSGVAALVRAAKARAAAVAGVAQDEVVRPTVDLWRSPAWIVFQRVARAAEVVELDVVEVRVAAVASEEAARAVAARDPAAWAEAAVAAREWEAAAAAALAVAERVVNRMVAPVRSSRSTRWRKLSVDQKRRAAVCHSIPVHLPRAKSSPHTAIGCAVADDYRVDMHLVYLSKPHADYSP